MIGFGKGVNRSHRPQQEKARCDGNLPPSLLAINMMVVLSEAVRMVSTGFSFGYDGSECKA